MYAFPHPPYTLQQAQVRSVLVMHPTVRPDIAWESVSCIGTGSLISTLTMQRAAVAEQKARLLDCFHSSHLDHETTWCAATWKQQKTTFEATQQSLAAVLNSATLEGSSPIPSSLGHYLDQATFLCWMMPSPSFESYPTPIEPEPPPPWPLQCAV